MSYPAITELVPHAHPMLAVDELVEWELGRARVKLTLRPDNLFVRDGVVEGVVALELMAQGVAACLGHEAFRAGDSVRVGMVIACRKLTLHRDEIAVGEELWVSAERVRGAEWLSHFDARLEDAAGELIAEATLTLVHADAPPDD